MIEEIAVTPWSSREGAGSTHAHFGEPIPPGEAPEMPKPPTVRRMKITRELLRQYGYTEFCEQCTHMEAFGEGKPGGTHAEACRARIAKAMEETDDGRARLAAEKARMELYQCSKEGLVMPALEEQPPAKRPTKPRCRRSRRVALAGTLWMIGRVAGP